MEPQNTWSEMNVDAEEGPHCSTPSKGTQERRILFLKRSQSQNAPIYPCQVAQLDSR